MQTFTRALTLGESTTPRQAEARGASSSPPVIPASCEIPRGSQSSPSVTFARCRWQTTRRLSHLAERQAIVISPGTFSLDVRQPRKDVILSEAPRGCLRTQRLWRGVEGPADDSSHALSFSATEARQTRTADVAWMDLDALPDASPGCNSRPSLQDASNRRIHSLDSESTALS